MSPHRPWPVPRSLSQVVLLFALACVPPSASEADAGAEPPTVAIEFADACARVEPCEGSPIGTWTYQRACVERGALWAGVTEFCPTATISNVSGTVQGGLTVSTTDLVSTITASIGGTIGLPAACLTHGADCEYLRDALAELLHADVYCAGSSACECSVKATPPLPASGPLEIRGSSLSVSGRTYDFCRSAEALTYRETTAEDADPAFYSLGR